jgi:transcriptional regulator with XRE-family HTH domain
VSKAEIDLLKGLHIAQKDVAAALKVSPQRVSQGLNEREAYLTPPRMRALYFHLENRNRDLAGEFRTRALADDDLTDGQREALRERVLPAIFDPLTDPSQSRDPLWPDVEEIWVFTTRPKEMDPTYLDRMTQEVFRISTPRKTKLGRMVYFVPPVVVERLCRYFDFAFRSIPRSERLEIIVVESSAISICPKFVIFEPMTEPKGFILGEAGAPDTYTNLSDGQVRTILEGLSDAGVGGSRKTFFVPPAKIETKSKSPKPDFVIRFNSTDVEADH